MKTLAPVIKWPGSKRRQADTLTQLIESAPFSTYYEPFVGSGAILGALSPERARAGDIQPELISLWHLIQSDPGEVAETYRKNWNNLRNQGHEYFYEIRSEFNITRSPHALMFLSRTCVNGLIRFNSNGDFNNSFHHTRAGINPDTLESIIHMWSRRIAGTTFSNADYEETCEAAKSDDIVYLDPPYMGNKGRYRHGSFDFERFWALLDRLNAKNIRWVLSIDGSSGSRRYDANLQPLEDLSSHALRILNGSSPFPRTQTNRTDLVIESIYTNFRPNV